LFVNGLRGWLRWLSSVIDAGGTSPAVTPQASSAHAYGCAWSPPCPRSGGGQLGPHLLEQLHDCGHMVLPLLAELAPPVLEDSGLADITHQAFSQKRTTRVRCKHQPAGGSAVSAGLQPGQAKEVWREPQRSAPQPLGRRRAAAAYSSNCSHFCSHLANFQPKTQFWLGSLSQRPTAF
jgi:hypothetical protein